MPQSRIAFIQLWWNYKSYGWSEKWFFDAADWRSARSQGDRLALIRTCMHARGVRLVWAHVGFTDNPRLRWNVRNWQRNAPAWQGKYETEPHTPHNCLQIRFETAEGLWANRYFCGLPDSFLAAMHRTGSLAPWFARRASPPVGDAALGFLTHFVYGLHWLQQNTLLVHDLGGDDAPSFEPTPWSNYVIREVRNRNRGRDFLHVSFEAGIPNRDELAGANLGFQPAFTTCGLITGVTRSCYIRPARWYPAGGVGVIRYYFVPPAFGAIDRPTVFWPYLEDLQLHNSDYPGERTTQPYRWQNGAPNTFLDREAIGTDADFAGEGLPPFDVTLPTPVELIVYCGVQFIAGEGGVETGGIGAWGGGFAGSGGVETGGEAFNTGVETGGSGVFWSALVGSTGVETGGGDAWGEGFAASGGVETGGDGGTFFSSLHGTGGIESGGEGRPSAGFCGSGGAESSGAGFFTP